MPQLTSDLALDRAVTLLAIWACRDFKFSPKTNRMFAVVPWGRHEVTGPALDELVARGLLTLPGEDQLEMTEAGMELLVGKGWAQPVEGGHRLTPQGEYWVRRAAKPDRHAAGKR